MPSFAELKAKASGMTSAGVEKMQNVRDRNTSVPMAKTNWDPYSGAPPPPPPPPRSLVNAKTKPQLAPLPPPPSRTSSVASPSLSRGASPASLVTSAPPLPSRSSSQGTPPPPPARGSGPPPPPPPRTTTIQHKVTPSPAAPPPIRRSTRPDLQAQGGRLQAPPQHPNAEAQIDWSNLTPEDKEVFFSWLDEFFAKFKPPMVVKGGHEADGGRVASPPMRASNKPGSWNQQPTGRATTAITSTTFPPLSHPPATEYDSWALQLAHYFDSSTTWLAPWYTALNGPILPPPLIGDTNHTYTSSWTSQGSNKTTNVGVLFSDLSFFWGTVQFVTTSPEDPRTTKRSAVYLPPPKPLGKQALVEAHATYGETIAQFAESFVGTGQVCARGECWDLANEALKSFDVQDNIPKPVPSISRTHGHLIFEGRATNRGKVIQGRWRGGDDRVRRGDVIEWRRARIGMKGGGFTTLGVPDHTAIIIRDAVPTKTPRDGSPMNPADLGIFAVVEQSQGSPPERADYDLSCFEEGEVWVYRPVGMQVYLGLSDVTAVPSPGLEGLLHL